jgi:hypothetical protein
MVPSRRFFISCVSDEFRAYRAELRGYISGLSREVKVQEDFGVGAATLLEMLDDYISAASAVLHLVGKSSGSKPQPSEVRTILARYPDFDDALLELKPDLDAETSPFTYTQWEAFLALYHRVPCFVYFADDTSVREPGWIADPAAEAAQTLHRQRLEALGKGRATLPFDDARDVALSFFKSFEDEATGASFATEEAEAAPVNWPDVPSSVTYSLADREPEVDFFLKLISGRSKERIFLLSGASDRGKSTLLHELANIAARFPPLQYGRGEFKNGLPLRDILSYLADDLGKFVRFQRFRREVDRGSTQMRTAFLQDLAEARYPVLLILDTYQEANDEAKSWVENHLLRLVSRTNGLRIVLAGQRVPVAEPSSPWAPFASCRELSLITDPAPWFRYRDALGLTEYSEETVIAFVKAAKGSPRLLGTLLSNLRQAS